jgi:tyrosinase
MPWLVIHIFSRDFSDIYSRVEWDGVTGNTEGRDSGTMGYCPHVSPIFSTWHRPYLALFEVSLKPL